jgi:hypothetical protein
MHDARRTVFGRSKCALAHVRESRKHAETTGMREV